MVDHCDFEFTQWIAKYDLSDIEQCFIDHDMNQFDTLNLSNLNLSKLLSDERVLSKPHLIQNIINALQSISKEIKPQIQRRLIFTTQQERDIFLNIEHYINRLNELENELQNTINNNIQNRKQQNNTDIDVYTTNNTQTLHSMRTEINNTINKLHMMFTQKQQHLETQLNGYRNNVKSINKHHTQHVDTIDNTLSACESIIDENIKYFMKSIQKCKDIVSKYEDNYDNDDNKSNLNDYPLQRYNTDLRETEIINTGIDVTKYYNHNLILLSNNRQKINDYIENELILNMKQIYCITMNDVIYNNIDNNVHKLIQIRRTNDEDIVVQPVQPVKKPTEVPPIAFASHPKDIEAQPPAAFPQNPKKLEEHKEQQMEGKEEEKEQKEPPPPVYNAGAAPAPKHMIVAQRKSHKQSTNVKVSVPKKLAMRKYKSDDLERPVVRRADAHARFNALDQDARNKELSSSPKPIAFETFWKCNVCTFAQNPGTFLICGMCHSSRQLSSVPMMRQHSLSVQLQQVSLSDSGVQLHQSKSELDQKGGSPLAMEESHSLSDVTVKKDKKKDNSAQMKRAQTAEIKVRQRRKLFGWSSRKSGKKGNQKKKNSQK